MPQPPSLTPEQRTAALAKAAQARKARAEIKDQLKNGRVTLSGLLGRAANDDIVGKMKVLAVLESLPGTGKVKARRLMEQIGISETPPAAGSRSEAARALCSSRRSPLILVVSGPGGAGKGTVIHELVARDPKLWLSRSWTTRPAATVRTRTPTPSSTARLSRRRSPPAGSSSTPPCSASCTARRCPSAPPGRDIVLEIDVQGAEQVRKRCKDVVCVLLVPPSRGRPGAADGGARGLRGPRAGAPRARRPRRLEAGRAFADAIVVNRDVGQATDELAGILERARRGAS